MMRRTYKSKKDTTGVLDHKDVLLTLDEKSSAFDAFYIQNIKQTKREMSCLGTTNQYGGPGNKVRKKKYVKRLVKPLEPVNRESISNSVYLTPDRSIRVNKAPDLFDQLLNSSSADKNKSPKSTTTNVFNNLKHNREGKTYMRKKVKKFNYSSSESDSEKENYNSCNASKNTTDINLEKLLIEKQDQPTHEEIDQSIFNILEKLPQLNKMAIQNDSINKSQIKFKPHGHRLTKNINSSMLDKTLLSSTPFKEKFRSCSIYKFSPISSEKVDISSYNLNASKTISPPSNVNLMKQNILESPDIKTFQSPILQSNKSIKSNMSQKINKSANISKKFNIDTSSSGTSCEDFNPDQITLQAVEEMSQETTESKLFLGFGDVTDHEELEIIKEAIDKIDKDNSKEDIQFLNETEDNSKSDGYCSHLQCTETEPFLGFSHQSNIRSSRIQKLCIEDSCLLNSSSNDDSVEQVTIQNYVENERESNDSDGGKAESVDASMVDLANETTENIQDVSRQSYVLSYNCDSEEHSGNDDSDNNYDTCNSEQSDTDDNINDMSIEVKIPKVEIIRLRTSTLEKYYNMLDNNSEVKSDTDDNINDMSIEVKIPKVEIVRLRTSTLEKYYNMLDNNSETSECANDSVSQSDSSSDAYSSDINELNAGNYKEANVNTENEISYQESIILSSSEGDCIETNSNDEERCISFVTTRRRNDVGNDTSIFVLDTTMNSPNGSDADKTVIDTAQIIEKTDLIETSSQNNLDNKLLKEWNNLQMERKTKKKSNMRKSEMPRKSFKVEMNETCSDIKDAIVLQPGKKWERSLSIYRRITQMDHFDQTIIDEECAHKGRNYRQSVINTMESQDTGSVHNVSISSRRSTFLSKPSRSTVRLIKHDTSSSKLSTSSVYDDLTGFLHDDCDDTVLELSKLSIADSEREITIVENLDDYDRGIDEAFGTTARDYVLRRCNQSDVILFDECYPEADLKNCHKIGEGVYGEVYLWRARNAQARVMKIVPIAGTTKVNGEHQKDYHEIISEIVIAMELSALRSPLVEIERCLEEGRDIKSLDLRAADNATDVFNEVLAVRCLYGPYPSRLLDLWELFDEVKGSENDNPAVLPADQQFVVLELANAGQDLESYQFNSAEQAYALFWQHTTFIACHNFSLPRTVAFGLAVGEESMQFEHRDLHWGNVLIAPTEQKLATFLLRGVVHRIPRAGVAATIIDYSLSRITLQDSVSLYNDLGSDESLFSAVGDYQFHVYRLMREKLSNEWKNFEPFTNILWLHYTVDKMITSLRYKRTNTKIHKHYISKLKGIKNRILEYNSATDFVLTDNEL